MYPKFQNTVRPTYFIPRHHVAIATGSGHELLTLYMLVKHQADQVRAGVIDVDINALSKELQSKPDFIKKALGKLSGYGMLFDEDTSELICLETFHQQLPVDDDRLEFAHQILDLLDRVESEQIVEVLMEALKDNVFER